MLDRTTFALTVAVSIVALANLSVASIEKEPVRVTHKNSGPKYEIDDVEKTKLAPEDRSEDNLVTPIRIPSFMNSGNNDDASAPSPSAQSANNEAPSDDGAPIGRISIRRIFLIPMMSPQSDASLWSRSSPRLSSEREDPEESQQPPSRFAANRPFWPFMPPRHHLFGGDEASRSPTPESSMERPSQMERPEANAGEREESDRPRLQIDPIQMMIELMQHALNSQTSPVNSLFKDLNKEASGAPATATSTTGSEGDNKPMGDTEGSLERPSMPSMPPMKNETKEDVIEIDGKKYLRKTVINRHVGENIIFMTKRLIFVPLNETTTGPEESTPSTPVATEGSVTSQTTTGPQEVPSTRASESKVEEAITSTTTTTAVPTTMAEVPSIPTSEATTTTTTTTTAAIPSTTTSSEAVASPEEPSV